MTLPREYEIALDRIKGVIDKSIRVSLILDFIQEYGGWKQHLEQVGIHWGAAGEEVGASVEHKKVCLHLENLKNLIKQEFREVESAQNGRPLAEYQGNQRNGQEEMF